jgi:hypothetical protein
MAEEVSLGLPGLSTSPGTHLCAFFRGNDERNRILFPYVREGLRLGDKCFCAFDAANRDAFDAELATEIDVEAAGDQLDVAMSSDTYLGRGSFSGPGMLEFWDQWASGALDGGRFPFARAAGEMTRTITEVMSPAELVAYESELNRFVPRYPQVLLCLYDLDDFSGQLLADIMQTHPKVLMGSTVLENLYYVEPDDLLARR